MNKKLHRVLDEIQKTEEKIAAWQEHLGELNIQKEMLEDAEIIKSVRSMRLNSRELLSVLEGIQNGTVVLSEEPEMAEDSGSAEIIKPENRAELTESMEKTTENQAETAENTAGGFSAGQGLSEGMAMEREDFRVKAKIKKYLMVITMVVGMMFSAAMPAFAYTGSAGQTEADTTNVGTATGNSSVEKRRSGGCADCRGTVRHRRTRRGRITGQGAGDAVFCAWERAVGGRYGRR